MATPGTEIGVIGPGAVGVVLGGLLAAAGHRVTFYARSNTRAPRSLFLEDGAGRRLTITQFSWATLADWNPATKVALVCVRGEQLASVLAETGSQPPRTATLAVASATLEPLAPSARRAGWQGPILRVGVGFGAWRREDGVYRWFPLLSIGTGVAHEGDRRSRAAQLELARALARAGLPARAAPSRLFHWLARTSYAIQTVQCLGLACAGWSFDALARDATLVEATARAMKQAARVVWTDGGPLGLAAGIAPLWLYRKLLRAMPRRMGSDVREVWKHHGPKVCAQIAFLTNQIEARARARGNPTDAILALAAQAHLG
jgi:ketopantoate reductase